MQEETEIDLVDLMKTLISRWKSILLVGLICLAAGGFSGMLKAAPTEEEVEIDEAAVAAAEAKILTEDDIKKEYERLTKEYEVNLKLYDHRFEALSEYQDAVDMLVAETENFKDIPETDSEARLSALIRISSLQSAVQNSKALISSIGTTMPVEPDTYDEYLEEQLKANETAEAELEELLKGSNADGPAFSAKYAVVGLAAGIVIMCMVWSAVYLLDGTVKTQQDISRGFGVSILGSPDKAGFAAANVINFMPEEASSVLITGSASKEDVNRLAEAVRKLAAGNIDIRSAEDLNNNADTAAMLSEVDAVVLVEKIKASKLKDVAEEIMMIRSAGKKIIGVAV